MLSMGAADHGDSAFTGLEAAIVLIAFIIIAAVFSFVVLGTGFFAAQKSQDAVHGAIEQTCSALVLGSTVIAKTDVAGNELDFVDFYLEIAAGRSAIDMDGVIYTIATQDTLVPLQAGDPRVELTWRCRGDTDDLLEQNEVVKVRIHVSDFDIGAGEIFTIEVAPPNGAALVVTRRLPSRLPGNEYCELL